MTIDVVFEDDDVLVVNKPAGLTTTRQGVRVEKSVESWLVDNHLGGVGLAREGIVHRLDKGTNGLLLVAKNQKALDNLQGQFKKRTVNKEYFCLCEGEVVADGVIAAPIGRSQFFGRWRVTPNGKAAVTLFKRLKRYRFEGKIYSLLQVQLKSGRTHQIRVHMAYLRWPLAGDAMYGGHLVAGLEWPFLQACHLAFSQPQTQQWLDFSLPLADDLTAIIKKMNELS